MSATNRGSKRSPRDFYPTPDWLTRAQLTVLKKRLIETGQWPPRVYEPACGDLAMVKVIQQEWPEAIIEYSDILPQHGGVDFLLEPPEPVFDLVMTNPPFSIAEQFQKRSRLWLKNPGIGLTCLLLRVNFLGGQERAEWMRANTPHVAITPKRPSMGVNKYGKPGTDATEYSWMTWPKWDPMIEILPTEWITTKKNAVADSIIDTSMPLVQS